LLGVEMSLNSCPVCHAIHHIVFSHASVPKHDTSKDIWIATDQAVNVALCFCEVDIAASICCKGVSGETQEYLYILVDAGPDCPVGPSIEVEVSRLRSTAVVVVELHKHVIIPAAAERCTHVGVREGTLRGTCDQILAVGRVLGGGVVNGAHFIYKCTVTIHPATLDVQVHAVEDGVAEGTGPAGLCAA